MLLFLLFLCFCFGAGILLRRADYRQRLILIVATAVSVLYYVLERLI